tara:strand:- start:4210 stop:4725 length:516 start_codon:yes stop_codon:yes gene_type:complete
VSVRTQEIGIVRCNLHASFQPVAIKVIVATKACDLFEALEDTDVARRELVSNPQSTLSPFIELEMRGSKAKAMSGVCVHVKRSYGEVVPVKHGEEAAQEAGVVDGKAGVRSSFDGLVLNHRTENIASGLKIDGRGGFRFMLHQELVSTQRGIDVGMNGSKGIHRGLKGLNV